MALYECVECGDELRQDERPEGWRPVWRNYTGRHGGPFDFVVRWMCPDHQGKAKPREEPAPISVSLFD